MEWEIIILSAENHIGKDSHQISLKCEIENMTQMNICVKQKHTHGQREQTCGFQGRENWGGIEEEIVFKRHKL